MMTASMQRFRSAILCACFLGAAYPAYGQNRDSEAADTIAVRQKETVPLQVQTPYPTLIHLAVEWLIEGDDNLNGQVTVRFRKVGDAAWREGLPLRRVPADRYELRNRGRRGQPQPDPPPPPIRVFEWANKHSGSLFDLMPNTEYEIALTLHDPDGGDAKKTVRAWTRPVPRAMANAPVRPVSPSTIASVQTHPGDILLLAPGDYGAFEATVNGGPGRPVVYRSEDGKAVFTSFSLKNRRHVFVEGITVENPERRGTGIQLQGAEECAVRYCTVRASCGIRASRRPGARNCYVADNVVEGPSVWISEAMGARGDNLGEGIQLTGPGNVICYNYLHGFRDCISTMESQNVEDQICVDIYHNDIYLGADDGIEADYCYNNCRIIRNRLTNCFVGVSSQPGLGGPVYFIRNAMYNLT